MHGLTLASWMLAASILGAGGAAPGNAPSTTIDGRIADAHRALAAHQPGVAIAGLEASLGDMGLAARPDAKPLILDLLRQSYEAAATQADAAGRPRDAAAHRENARILARKPAGPAPGASPTSGGTIPASAPVRPVLAAPTAPGAAPEPAPSSIPTPSSSPPPEPVLPADAAPVEAPRSLPEMTIADEPEPAPTEPPTTPPPTSPAPERLPEVAAASTADPALTPAPSGPGLVEADAAFRAKRYAEAGQIYGALAAENRLPADRVEHWAYCRSSVVARAIAANPKTEAEWQGIDAEIERIRQLAPTNWLGEYLRNRAAARPTARKAPQTGSTVIRAASPEEPPARTGRFGRPVAAPRPVSPPAPAPTPGPAASQTPVRVDTPLLTDPSGTPGGPVGRWRMLESANFRVFHANPELAEQVVRVAEQVRQDGVKRWSGKAPIAPWNPRCEIYLFPNAPQYAQMTGQPLDSPGFSTMGMNDGQITARRVSVRTDHAGMLAAVLPHEITHVILADLFTQEQIPRWADEGLAVLMEPAHEQKRRANDLVEPLGKNLLFPIDTLMQMDYPDEQYWNLYYAQSVSLTRFLVEQGPPERFVKFLQAAQTNGFEAELKRVYGINGFPELQARWVTYARAHATGETPMATASTTEPTRRTR